MTNCNKVKVYNDFRDALFKFDKNILFLDERVKYSLKRNKIRFLLFNDIDSFFYPKKDIIKYIKICHIIRGREAFVYELVDVKNFETIEVLLNKVDESEEEELYLIYYVDDQIRFFKDISKSYSKLIKFRKDDIAHFHFKNGNVKKIVPYFMYNGSRFYIVMVFLIFLILFILSLQINCNYC